jgi:hypothetical protein
VNLAWFVLSCASIDWQKRTAAHQLAVTRWMNRSPYAICNGLSLKLRDQRRKHNLQMPKAEARSSLIPEEQWSEPEKWAWQEIRAGRMADFNARERRLDAPLDPTSSQGWGEDRKIRSDFLRQIVLRPPHRGQIPADGVRILGAWLPEGLELDHGRLACQFWLRECRFEGPANLEGLLIDAWFSLEFVREGCESIRRQGRR